MAESRYVSPSLKDGRLSKEREVHSKGCDSFELKSNTCPTTVAVGALESEVDCCIRGDCQHSLSALCSTTAQQLQIRITVSSK